MQIPHTKLHLFFGQYFLKTFKILEILVLLLLLLCDIGRKGRNSSDVCTCQNLPGEESRKMPQLIIFTS